MTSSASQLQSDRILETDVSRSTLLEKAQNLRLPSGLKSSPQLRNESGEGAQMVGYIDKVAQVAGEFDAGRRIGERIFGNSETVVESAVQITKVTYDDRAAYVWAGNNKYAFEGLEPDQKAALIRLFAGQNNENVRSEKARTGDQWRIGRISTWGSNPYERKSLGDNPEDTISRPRDEASEIILRRPVTADIERYVGQKDDRGNTSDVWRERSGAMHYASRKVTTYEEPR